MSDTAFSFAKGRATWMHPLSFDQTAIDWLRLADDPAAAFHWLDRLSKGAAPTFTLDPPSPLTNLIKAFFFENRAGLRLRAEQLIHFGYPYFLFRDGEQWWAAPLLLWPCRLEPAQGEEGGSWSLHPMPEYQPFFNQGWATWAQSREGSDWTSRLKQLFKDGRPQMDRMARLALEMGAVNGWSIGGTEPALTPFPLETPEGDGFFCWSASLLLFADAHRGSQSDDTNWPRQQWRDGLNARQHAFGLSTLSPSEATSWSTISTESQTLISLPPGADQSNLLSFLVENALSNDRRTLIVSTTTPGLEQLRQQLRDRDLAALSFFWRDDYYDADLWLEQLKAYERKSRPTVNHQTQRWQGLTEKLRRDQQQLDLQYQAVRKPVFGQERWLDIVGRYLLAQRRQGKELLSSQVSALNFTFTPAEYLQLHRAITHTQPLLPNLGTIQHPLNQLNAGIFLHQDEEEGRRFIEEKSSTLLDAANRLNGQFIRYASRYADELTQYYERHYQELYAALRRMENTLNDSLTDLGQDLLRSRDGTLRLYGVFGKKFREVADRRAELADQYDALREAHRVGGRFDFSWPDPAPLRQPLELQRLLRDFGDKLQSWRDQLSDLVKEESLRLNGKTALAELPSARQAAELEEKLEQLVEEVNATGLYQLPLACKMLTIVRQQKFLTELVDQLENTRRNLHDFEAFHRWQRNWFSLSEQTRRVITALVRTRPADWSAAFDSWYFDQLLSRHYQPLPSSPPNAVSNFAERHHQWRQLTVTQLAADWQQARDSALRDLKPWLKANAKTVRHAEFFEQLFQHHGAAARQFFPVWLTTPDRAVRWSGQARQPLFDLLVVADAHALDAGYAPRLFSLARRVVLFSQDVLPATRTGDSLAERARRNQVAELQLPGHFPPSGFHPLPAIRGADPADVSRNVDYVQLDGRFDQHEETNEAEAQEILRLLNKIEPTPQRTYPRVGIVTFTPGQRNLILDYFLRIKRRRLPGAETIQQLERNGMGVYHISECVGQRFDRLYVSVTYGPVDLHGRLSTSVDLMNSAGQLLGLLQAPASARERLVIINSLSASLLWEWLGDRRGRGLALLAGLLHYYRALAEGDKREQRYLTERLSELLPAPEPLAGGQLLLRAIAERLSAHLPDFHWQGRWWRGQYWLPLVGQAADGWTVVLQLDGFLATHPVTSYQWEHDMRRQLTADGFHPIDISPARWWRHPAQESLRLATMIRQMRREQVGEEE